jgi:hypothetical protein
MPPVPQECQTIADELTALQTTDQNLRNQLAGQTGATAWATLAQLGQTRQQITQKTADLQACIQAHSAALQANLVIIDLTNPAGPPAARTAHLWEISAAAATLRDTSSVNANFFSFAGPFPAQFGISVVTTGAPNVIGPDFLSASLTPAGVNGPLRIEVVLAPVVQLSGADLSQFLSASFAPGQQQVQLPSVSGMLSVESVAAQLAQGAVNVTCEGTVLVATPLVPKGRFPFSASVSLAVTPTLSPGGADVADLTSVTDPKIQLSNNAPTLVSLVLPTMSSFVVGLFADQLRKAIRKLFPSLVAKALALPNFPDGVTIAVRQLQITPNAVSFQPALGAIGTTLSTFNPPAIPAP